MFVFSSKQERGKGQESHGVVQAVSSTGQLKDTGRGMFLGEEVDRKAYVERLEKQYDSVARKNDEMSRKVTKLNTRFEEMRESIKKTKTAVLSLQAVAKRLRREGSEPADKNGAESRQQLDIVAVQEPDQESMDVYLPAGSFVSGTLLTGVYAPADGNNSLPVLIRLDEAFTGPNASAIALEGAFVLGKATGDLNSERALIEAEKLAAVFPTGASFEQSGVFGYLTDRSGQLGLKGVVVRNTAGRLAASFMSGFMGGASQAVADGEVSAVTQDGKESRTLTGNAAKHALFSGMAQSTAQLSRYYQQQLDMIVPAVMVQPGVRVYVIVQKGFRIHGMARDSVDFYRSVD
jgi:type IV secretory pathway VirB10-like protein